MVGVCCLPLFATTWYVRPDGGTRYAQKVPTGQCDGLGDKAYPGKGSNQHCAFKDVRSLWTDGVYTADAKAGAPSWGWIGAGGDTYILRGSIAKGVSYRIGQDGPGSKEGFGLFGDPFSAGAPPPLSGTAEHHTRILGENYADCHAAAQRTQLHGGFGVNAVLRMNGASYIDVACVDLTDFSSCGLATQTVGCHTPSGELTDFAKNGISWSNQSTHDTLTDVRIHGMASAGMIGPTGDGVVMKHLDVLGNASSGWNADDASGTTGTGTVLVQDFDISWNGCAEEYPITHKVPYGDCTDDSSGGYGDGFGTATLSSNPAWKATFDHGVTSYNTQDGLDALHLSGPGSTMTITNVLAYGNMGQQIKIGGASGTATGNRIIGSCNAMRQAIPGTPPGYNKKLGDFCRAGDGAVAITVNNGRGLVFKDNIVYAANRTAIEIECDPQGGGACDERSKIDFRDNIFLGFLNNAANGYPGNATDDYSNPIYDGSEAHPFVNKGSLYSGNTTFHAKKNWRCPWHGESNAVCGDPHLVDETWHVYGFGDMSPVPGSVRGKASGASSVEPEDLLPPFPHGRHRVRAALGYLCAGGVLATAAWQGARRIQGRAS